MTRTLQRYKEQVYAGYLAKNIAVRLGAPVEPINWTYERIQQTFPEITDYLKPVENFASDDDINGPTFFVRALLDEETPEIDAAAIGRAWVNYAREGIGMFWWGGDGVSTEHTAYNNLAKGIPAPASGSIEKNGLTMAEQIGGQIFIDTWGLLFPNDPRLAADFAEKAASVSHDQNGIYGARFMTACISEAFGNSDIQSVIEVGLKQIPADSTYAKITRAVIKFHADYPDDFRLCRDYLNDNWGYDRYPGVCHIIPNAGICILSLLYGAGDFSRTIEIATMCGWDTDCNAGNVGTILGVMNGLDNIPAKYRQPINDTAIASSGLGYLNMIDIPSFAQELVNYRQYYAGAINRKQLLEQIKQLNFSFDLPGSVHGFKTNNTNRVILRHGSALGKDGNALEVLVDNLNQSDEATIFIKTNYHVEDLDDERYDPVFSPKVYSGQTARLTVNYTGWEGNPIKLSPYVKAAGRVYKLASVSLEHQAWTDVEFKLPEVVSGMIDEVGLYLESQDNFTDGNGTLGVLLVDSLSIAGDFSYEIKPGEQRQEFQSVTPFTHQRTSADLKSDRFVFKSEATGVSLTGHYYTKNVQMAVMVDKESAESFDLVFRAKGLQDYFAVRITDDSVGIYEAKSLRLLTQQALEETGESKRNYKLEVHDETVKVYIDNDLVFTYDELPISYGAYGIGQTKGSISCTDLYISGEIL